MAQRYPSIPAKILKTAILSTDTAFKLRDITWYTDSTGSDVTLTSTDFGDFGYGVFEPNTPRQEFFKFDPSTIANYTTTGITISSRGLPWSTDYSTEASSRKFAHDTGATVLLFTDAPALWNTMANKGNAETITGVWTFANTAIPKQDTYLAPTADTEFAPKKYCDDLALAGAPDASETVKGIIELATVAELAAGTSAGGTGARLVAPGSACKSSTAGAADANKIPVLDTNGVLSQTFLDSVRTWGAVQSFTANNCQITSDADSANDAVRQSYLLTTAGSYSSGNLGSGTSGEALAIGDTVYLKASDGKLWKTDADGDESTYSFVGINQTTAGAADVTVSYVKPGGIATGLSSLTAGSYYFLSGTAGGVSVTPHATRLAKIGQALTTTTMRVIEPKFVRSGSLTITGTGDTVVTTGFYPSYILIRAGTSAGGYSAGDDTNTCMCHSSPYLSTSLAWNALSTSACSGTVSAKSQTGFTLTEGAHHSSDNLTLTWTAFL